MGKPLYVGHLLAKPSGNRIGSTDPAQLIAFIGRAEKRLGPLADFSIVGGEPFLHPDAFRAYLDAGYPVNTTTNGIFDFESVKDIIGRLRHITFSIDGWPEQHNQTRKSLTREVDPFTTSYRNLCKTVETFPGLSVMVQGSITEDAKQSQLGAIRYYTLMLAAGVKRGNIRLGPSATTLRKDGPPSYSQAVPKLTRTSPCCDHLIHKGYYIYGNKIYGSYYRFEDFEAIAHLGDSIEDILKAKQNYVMTTMPMLSDQTCMTKCTAVGVCWGSCTADRHAFHNGKPSTVCDRAYKEQEVIELARKAAARHPII